MLQRLHEAIQEYERKYTPIEREAMNLIAEYADNMNDMSLSETAKAVLELGRKEQSCDQ